jgi:hypothetical protein
MDATPLESSMMQKLHSGFIFNKVYDFCTTGNLKMVATVSKNFTIAPNVIHV